MFMTYRKLTRRKYLSGHFAQTTKINQNDILRNPMGIFGYSDSATVQIGLVCNLHLLLLVFGF